MSRTVLSRGRALASLTTVLGLGLATAAVASSPAQSAAPGGDCADAYPVSALTRDQTVTGLTVTGEHDGSTPEGFTGSVIGVLQDGIAPDVDMVMMRLSSPEIDRVGGIWQGMSGSPVYAEDGRLIGAVAYGMSWGPSPVAGVTPFADMNTYLPPASTPATVRVGDRAARAIAAETGVSAARAAEGFSQLGMPLGVSGVSGNRLERAERSALREKRPWLPASTYKMGAAAAPGEGPGAETIEAGGNLAASLSYGDVTAAGVGTATSVCEGHVVGFGHPMTFSGDGATLAMHPADALYIQEESLGAPFKVANLGAPVGTITDDHLTGITGELGAGPVTAPVTSTVRYAGRQRRGASHVAVTQFTPDATFYENLANHDAVLDGYTKGSELQTWTMRGTSPAGAFTLASANRYASQSDITWESAWAVADLAYLVSRVPGAEITGVSIDSGVTKDSSTFALKGLQQRVGGRWATVGKGAPVRARAGTTVSMRATVSDGSTTRTIPFSLAVPARTEGSVGGLYVTGGGSGDMFEEESFSEFYYGDGPDSIASIRKMLAKQTRNDQLSVNLGLETPSAYKVVRATSAPQAKVVTGMQTVKVLVR
jgi:hypothetical protein